MRRHHLAGVGIGPFNLSLAALAAPVDGLDALFFDARPDNFKPAPDQRLNDPRDVARSVVFALRQPPGATIPPCLTSA